MSQRKSDRDRAIIRRDRKHGETEDQFQARILETLQALAPGMRVTIRKTNTNPSTYTVAAYDAEAAAPSIKITRGTLAACASNFEQAIGTLAAGFCPTKKQEPTK